jgi:hypothetical protein
LIGLDAHYYILFKIIFNLNQRVCWPGAWQGTESSIASVFLALQRPSQTRVLYTWIGLEIEPVSSENFLVLLAHRV